MTDENQEQKRALVIGAHPDDNEVGCGGTVAKLVRQGWVVTFIICTNGNKGSHDPTINIYHLSAQREEEQLAAARVLGVKRVIFLRYNDGELEPTSALRGEMALYIRHLKPHAIFTHDPWRPYMLHPDHRAVGFAVVDGLVSARDHLYMPGLEQIGIPFWRPDYLYLWSAGEPDYTEDISDTLEIKLAALQEHRTQLAVSETFVERMRQRFIDQGKQAGYAAGEEFRRMKV